MAAEKPNPLSAVLYRPEAEAMNPELLEIFEKTMLPYLTNIMSNLPDGGTKFEKLHEALRIFFGVDHRTIDTWIAQEDFLIAAPFLFPHDIIWNPLSKENLRLVRKNEVIITRMDTRTPWELELQVVSSLLRDLDDRRQFSVGFGDFHKALRPKLKLVGTH